MGEVTKKFNEKLQPADIEGPERGPRPILSPNSLPMRHGHLLLIVTIALLSACKKEKDEAPAPPAGGGSTGTLTSATVPAVQMTIDGSAFSFAEGGAFGAFADNSLDPATPPVASTAQYGFIMHALPDPADLVFGVNLGFFNFQGSAPTDTQFFGFFPTGPVTYGDTETYEDLAMITWWDEAGQEWSTFWGEDQTGSSFNIVETLSLPDPGSSSILVRATFTCKLYHDSENGQFKRVTNGTGVFRFEKN